MVGDSKYSISKQIKRNTTTKKTNYNIGGKITKFMPKIMFLVWDSFILLCNGLIIKHLRFITNKI